MILDGHIHLREDSKDIPTFLERLKSADIDGGIIISVEPRRSSLSSQQRLDDVMAVTEVAENLFPFFWVDPLAADAADQIKAAVERGVAGFKVICEDFEPGDPRAMPVYRRIAAAEKPILFHSGILWHPTDNARFNRPLLFESLLAVEGLRFSLAHIGWPWCDETIAVYGKFLNAYTHRPDLSVEMFIDVTPGTPPIYRRDALVKLFTVGYDVENNVIFGTDSCVNNYNTDWAREWIERDNKIYNEIGLGEITRTNIFSENLLRFVGVDSRQVKHKGLRPGE